MHPITLSPLLLFILVVSCVQVGRWLATAPADTHVSKPSCKAKKKNDQPD